MVLQLPAQSFPSLSHMGGQKRCRCPRRFILDYLNHILFAPLNQHCLVHVFFPTFSVSSASMFSCTLNQLHLWRWANNCGGNDSFIHKPYDIICDSETLPQTEDLTCLSTVDHCCWQIGFFPRETTGQVFLFLACLSLAVHSSGWVQAKVETSRDICLTFHTLFLDTFRTDCAIYTH